MTDLSLELIGIKLKNPVLVASGTFGYGEEYDGLFDVRSLGALVTKGLTLQPWHGNPPPRICETPAGLLNSVGLQNPGVKHFISDILPEMLAYGMPVIANIAGFTKEEFVSLAEYLDQSGVAALELNISCPNVKAGGMALGTCPELAAEVVAAVRKASHLPLIVKLTPNVTDIVTLARAVVEAGADALSLINTLLGMAIDVKSRRPVLANVTGGLSGPAIRPVAVRAVWQVAQAVQVPLIGMGGICNARDALEFILAGATAVAVGSASFHDPLAAVHIIEGLDEYFAGRAEDNWQSMIGAAWKQC
jgi:dihydroorotate dehydrogenase (NAD+) catalytic subunit